MEGGQGRNSSKAGTWPQELREKLQRNTAYQLAFTACSICFVIQDRLTRGGTAHSGLGLPMSITNQECPIDQLADNLMEVVSQLRLLLPRQRCVRLTKT